MPIADAECVQLVAGSITPIFFSLELATVTDFRTSAAAACRCHRRGTQPLMARACNQRMRCKRKLKMRPSASAINYAADTDVNAYRAISDCVLYLLDMNGNYDHLSVDFFYNLRVRRLVALRQLSVARSVVLQ